jgi:hypothetical protein
VASQIALPVTIDVETPNRTRARDRILPDTGVDMLTAPLNLFGQANIY